MWARWSLWWIVVDQSLVLVGPRLAPMADVGGGVCPVRVACVVGSLSSGSCGVTTGVSPAVRVARSS